MNKKKLINYYAATWLIALEWTFKIWQKILIHCLKLKKIDHKNIQFRKPNLNLIFQNELADELEGEAPFTLEFIRDELVKEADKNSERLASYRRERAEAARASIFDPDSAGFIHRSTFAKTSKEKTDRAAEISSLIAPPFSVSPSSLFSPLLVADSKYSELLKQISDPTSFISKTFAKLSPDTGDFFIKHLNKAAEKESLKTDNAYNCTKQSGQCFCEVGCMCNHCDQELKRAIENGGKTLDEMIATDQEIIESSFSNHDLCSLNITDHDLKEYGLSHLTEEQKQGLKTMRMPRHMAENKHMVRNILVGLAKNMSKNSVIADNTITTQLFPTKDELTLARNTKTIKTTTDKQIKRQVDASKKATKTSKSGVGSSHRKPKKVSKRK